MMDNEKIATAVLSIILNCEVKNLQSKSQETAIKVKGGIKLSRFDFKAVIANEKGEYSTVIIEIQKYRAENPIERFRTYLAENYKQQESIPNHEGEITHASLPIISIYILGYDLPEFNCRAIRVDNKPYDIVGNKEIAIESEFVQKLTHKCFILITAEKEGIEVKNTKIEKFINLFIQKLRGEEKNTVITINQENYIDEKLKEIVEHLHNGTRDKAIIRAIKAEKEYYKNIQSLEKQNEELVKNNEIIKQQVEKERLKTKKEKQKAEEEKRKVIELVKMLSSLNVDSEKIASQTGLSISEIKAIVKK
jgi:hypothetical protein